MPPSATKNTSTVSSGFVEGFGNLATQQQAKSMSQQYLNSNAGGKPTVYNNDVTAMKDIASFMGNQANQTYNERYQQQKEDATQFAKDARAVAWNDNERKFEQQQSLASQQAANQRPLNSLSGGNSGGGGSSSGSTSFGMNAPTPSTSAVADFNQQQFNTANNNRMFSEANAAGDIKRDKEQTDNQKYLSDVNHIQSVDMMNRRFSMDAQLAGHQRDYETAQLAANRNFTAGESAAERASKERQVAMDAQSRMYGSMFSAFSGGGNQNYQYWGGKV